MSQSELLRFLALVKTDAALRFHGQSGSGIRISRIDHPGEYPGRHY